MSKTESPARARHRRRMEAARLEREAAALGDPDG